MAEFTIPKHGTICWRELATKDLSAAETFYKEMFGWTLEQSKVTEMKYSEIHIDGKAVGGIMPMDENWGDAPSHWTAYVAVTSADETAEKIKENGGSLRCDPFDAPNVGRIALATAPDGAGFAVIQFEQPA